MNIIQQAWNHAKQNWKAIGVVILVAASLTVGYLTSNGAYHTNSNIAWHEKQGYTQGVQDGQTAVVGLARQCGATGVSAAIIFITPSGTVGTQCYPVK